MFFFKKFNSNKYEDAFIIFFTILTTLYIFNLPLNSYLILKNNYHVRLIQTYGFCEKESFGYVEKINKRFNFQKNIKTFNFKDFPSESSVFFFNPNFFFDDKKIIILNYDQYNDQIKKEFYQKFKSYKILDNYQNKCFFVERE
jgi:hypothetical protein